ncbi:MAG: InlB B-repeat-containing protein [Limnochordia bacterium]|jgi:hypothetical protein
MNKRINPLWFIILTLALLLTGCGGGGGGGLRGGPRPTTFSLSGRVVDEDQQPLDDITVYVGGNVVTTDANGRWQAGGLSGTVTVIPKGDGWIFEPLQDSFSRETKNITFTGRPTGGPIDGKYSLEAIVVGNGSLVVEPSGKSFEQGTIVNLTANPQEGWSFSHWEGDLTGTANPASLTMDNHKTVYAIFVEENGTLYRINLSVEGDGSVTFSPPLGEYPAGTKVQLLATPALGWRFSHWKGDLSASTNPVEFTINKDMSITARFDETGNGFSIQEAIDNTQDGQIVSIPPGTYYENIVINGRNLTLQGQSPMNTIIDGQSRGACITITDSTVTIRGLTITNGSGFEKGGNPYGGGIYIRNAAVTIEDNIIENNKVLNLSGYGKGGGIFIDSPSTVTIRNNEIRGNISEEDGGGIGSMEDNQVVIEGNTFSYNTAPRGGGITFVGGYHELRGNTFVGNQAHQDGGALCLLSDAQVVLEGNHFTNNLAISGGAIWRASSASLVGPGGLSITEEDTANQYLDNEPENIHLEP